MPEVRRAGLLGSDRRAGVAADVRADTEAQEMTLHCPVFRGKIRYGRNNRKRAAQRSRDLQRTKRLNLRVYLCPHCDGYHLTKQPRASLPGAEKRSAGRKANQHRR